MCCSVGESKGQTISGTHGHEEGHDGGAYFDNKLHHNDWKLNRHSVCVSHPSAETVRRLKGIKYMTISLVLPTIYKLLGNLEKDYLRQHPEDTTPPVAGFGHTLKEARKKYVAKLTCRSVTDLSTDTKRLLVIATVLDPPYQHCTFRSEVERRWPEVALCK